MSTILMDLYQNGRIRNTKSKGNGLSVKTVKDIKIALQTCLQKAVDEELIPTNPCKSSVTKGRTQRNANTESK